jgi:hypothetical protein
MNSYTSVGLFLTLLPLIALPILGEATLVLVIWGFGFYLFNLVLGLLYGVDNLTYFQVFALYLAVTVSLSIVIFFLATEFPKSGLYQNKDTIYEAARWNEIARSTNEVLLESRKKEIEDKNVDFPGNADIPEKINFIEQLGNKIRYFFFQVFYKLKTWIFVDLRFFYGNGLPRYFEVTYFSEISVSAELERYKNSSTKVIPNFLFSVIWGTLTIYDFINSKSYSLVENFLIIITFILFLVFEYFLLKKFVIENPSLNQLLGWISLSKRDKQLIGFRFDDKISPSLQVKFFSSEISMGEGFMYLSDNSYFLVFPSQISKKALRDLLRSSLNKDKFFHWQNICSK